MDCFSRPTSFPRSPISPRRSPAARPRRACSCAHTLRDKRDEIDVLFDGKQGEIVLDGDATRWQGDRPADWQQIMNGILLDRIHRNGLRPSSAGSQRTKTSDSSGQ